MFWVFCNRCLLPFEGQNTAALFVVTNCGHVFCNDCKDSATKPKCLICSNPNVHVTSLDANMQPDVKAVFADVSSLAKALGKALEFQLFHIRKMPAFFRKSMEMKFENHLRDMNQKLALSGRRLEEASLKVKQLEAENARLKELVVRLKKAPQPSPDFRVITSPPTTKRQSAMLHEMSMFNYNPVTPAPLRQQPFSRNSGAQGSFNFFGAA